MAFGWGEPKTPNQEGKGEGRVALAEAQIVSLANEKLKKTQNVKAEDFSVVDRFLYLNGNKGRTIKGALESIGITFKGEPEESRMGGGRTTHIVELVGSLTESQHKKVFGNSPDYERARD